MDDGGNQEYFVRGREQWKVFSCFNCSIQSFFSLSLFLVSVFVFVKLTRLDMYFSGSIPEEKDTLPAHTEVTSDSAEEHSYDEDEAHILSPLLDETSPVRVQVMRKKSNGSRPNSGRKSSASAGASDANRGSLAEGSAPMEMRQLMGANNRSKAIAISNGRSANYGSSPSASFLMSDRNGADLERGRHRKMTVGSSESSDGRSSGGNSDDDEHGEGVGGRGRVGGAEGDPFDTNLKFS